MSDVRCPSCGDSFRVPDFAVPAGATAKCPWCGDTFSMMVLSVHLAPLAELIGADGEPISMAELVQATAPMALAGAGPAIADGLSDAAMTTPSLMDTDPAMLGAVDLPASDFDAAGLETADFDAVECDSVPVGETEVANDVREFAEEGEAFADAGIPEPTAETTEWNQVEDEYDIQEASQPRPLEEVTDVGLGREERAFVPRPRAKRQAAPLKSIIGIVVGGLMAFPLAAGILALAGKPLDLGFWPFDGQTISMNSQSQRSAAPPMEAPSRVANTDNRAGRSLADDMPSLDVDPPSLAESPDDNPLDNVLAEAPPATDLADVTPPPAIELPPLDLTTPVLPADEPEMTEEVVNSKPAVTEPDPADQPTPEPMPAEITEAIPEPAPAPQPAVEELAVAPAEPEPVVESTTVEPVAPAPPETMPEVSPALQAALEDASAAMGAVFNYDNSEGVKGQRSRLADLFSKVASVGDVASIDDDAAVGSLIERLVDSDLMKDLSPAAPNWARYSKRPNNGMLATGKLIRENDQWLLQWSGPTPLEIRFADPSIAEEGASVIILGTIQQTTPSTIVDVKYLQKQ